MGREQSFRSELDSRHRFSSREHQRLYANREKFRDAFYLLMKRDYAMDRSGKAFRTEALALFDELSDANLSWFSALFVSELMNQVCVFLFFVSTLTCVLCFNVVLVRHVMAAVAGAKLCRFGQEEVAEAAETESSRHDSECQFSRL